jgi:hypothetical protein
MVTATVNVSISGPPKDIRIGSIERRFSNGRLLCSAMGLSREECSKFENKLNHVNVSLESVELFTRDYDIESKIRQWIKNNEDNNGNGDSGKGSDVGNNIKNGNESELIEKNKRLRRQPWDEIPDDKYIEPMDGRGRELKKDTYPVNPNSNEKSPETIYNGNDWGIKAPNVKIISTTETKNSIRTNGSGTDSQQNEKNLYPTPEEFKLQQAAKIKQQQDADRMRNEALSKRKVDQQKKYYEGQLSYFEEQNKAINRASDAAQGYITNTMSRIYEAENQYASYQQNVSRITKFSETDDPEEVIDQYYRKIAEFERSLNTLYKSRLQNVNSEANKMRSNSSDPLCWRYQAIHFN